MLSVCCSAWRGALCGQVGGARCADVVDGTSSFRDRMKRSVLELVESRWYQYFLHNQLAQGLKALLLLHGGQHAIVINVPWYLSDT